MKIAIVGAGFAGLSSAKVLRAVSHDVTVFERADAPGGLLRYGIPEFKMEKRHIDRRLDQMRAEGTEFRTGVNVGVDITAAELREQFDAVVLAGGATAWRDLPVAGRDAPGAQAAGEPGGAIGELRPARAGPAACAVVVPEHGLAPPLARAVEHHRGQVRPRPGLPFHAAAPPLLAPRG